VAERLHKVLSAAGIASRRAAEALIREGRVAVNGIRVTRPVVLVEESDLIAVDGKVIDRRPTRRYLMLHKPAGFVTTLRDTHGRRTVSDLVKAVPERVFPVGRLDCASEGLLLMTNDGDFALRVQHPRFQIPKTYLVLAGGRVTGGDLKTLAGGLVLEDGPFVPRAVAVKEARDEGTWLEMTVTEGRNRVIRRAMRTLGYPVRRLIRVAVGDVRLGTLRPGRYRDLTAEERQSLMNYWKKYP